MDEITFFDLTGVPVAYTDDGEHIFLFSGTPVAYFSDDSVYDFGGEHLGRFADGVIRDHSGAVVLFTDGATAGPPKPLTKLKPTKSLKRLKPLKSIRRLAPLRRLDRFAWSGIPALEFFGVDE